MQTNVSPDGTASKGAFRSGFILLAIVWSGFILLAIVRSGFILLAMWAV